ncbi:esterase [Dacryopinax primogenitus]|uniref:Esterase n=1 Tax=Dacryopinax primogenitus (strain DJM 731) TaxID=1858805 RepID=M5FPX3_DACPD|nr:esterase [Dacryopinax primogenitus]EJT97383.1 esterase [Dacryopinax primogenitus]
MSSLEVHGTVSPGFESIRQTFGLGQSGDIGGAQLAIYDHGVKVVDLWTGSDPVRGQTFPEDGLVVFMSATKGLTAIVAHLLIQRGLLDVDAPVSKYWPEFAKNAKEKITTRMFLNHTSGLAALPAEANITITDVTDSEKIIHVIEDMMPFWEPGTAFFYHAFTYGHLVGEVVRRITGRTVGQYFREEIAQSRGLDLWIGLPEALEPRVVPWTEKTALLPAPGSVIPELPAPVAPSQPPFDMSAIPLGAALGAVMMMEKDMRPFMNSRQGHACEIPAANGIGDARSLAKLYASLLGSVDSHPQLLDHATVRTAMVAQTDDLTFPHPFNLLPLPRSRMALGFQLCRPACPMLGPSLVGHPGAGGRLAFADLDSGISVGYVCTNPIWEPEKGKPDPRWAPWMEALKEIIERKE